MSFRIHPITTEAHRDPSPIIGLRFTHIIRSLGSTIVRSKSIHIMKVFGIISLISALASPIAAQLLCTSSYMNSPLYKDCKDAFSKLPKPPANNAPVPCLLVYASRWRLAESGSCKIEGYSSGGGAACLDRAKVIEAAEKILASCQLEDRVEGGAALSTTSTTLKDPVFEGVSFVVSAAGVPNLKKRSALQA